MIAVIGGTSLLSSALFAELTVSEVNTPYGAVHVHRGDGFVFLQRHGTPADTPPHRINHKANLKALVELGATRTIAVNSTGSLRADLAPGTLVVPDDYFNLFNPPTFHDEHMVFTVPGLDQRVRQTLLTVAKAEGLPVADGGVYVQVQGPILETPAEIRFLAQLGDVVGMTMAHEAILARELGQPYASICMVDNFANGIANVPLSLEAIDDTRDQNLRAVETVLRRVLEQAI